MNQCVPFALHVSYSWLAYVLFHTYHLDACEQKSLGKHAYLSSWRLRYGWNDMIFALYCLSAWGIYLENLENPLWSSSLICQSSTKAIWWYFLKTIYTYAACFFCALSFVKLLWPLENSFHAFMIKIHMHTLYPLAMLLWEVSIVPSTHSTK